MASKKPYVNYNGQTSELLSSDVLTVFTQNSNSAVNTDVPFTSLVKVPITQFTTISMPAGNYKIEWSAEVNQTTTIVNPTITCEYTGTVLGRYIGRTAQTTNYNTISGFGIVAISGIHTIGLYYISPTNTIVNLRNARVLITRVN